LFFIGGGRLYFPNNISGMAKLDQLPDCFIDASARGFPIKGRLCKNDLLIARAVLKIES